MDISYLTPNQSPGLRILTVTSNILSLQALVSF